MPMSIPPRTLHELALLLAEWRNPEGKHAVTGIEIDGDPEVPGDVRITVATRIPCEAQMVDIKINQVLPPNQ